MHVPKYALVSAAAILLGVFSQSARAEKTDTITQYGITWKLSQPVEVGRFVTGDYYVVGNCEVVAITPPPGNGRNGSELNRRFRTAPADMTAAKRAAVTTRRCAPHCRFA